MTYSVLVSTSSFIDTPGAHVSKLLDAGFEVVKARGPLNQEQLLSYIGDGNKFDAFICGEDDFNANVLRAAAPRAKVISKYGVGLDKIDLAEAEKLGIKVTNTPGVNHTTVTELTFGLLLSLTRHIPEQNALVHKGEWRRMTGRELAGKTLGILGFGRVGKEVAKRAMAFGMNVRVFNTSWSQQHSAYLDELTQVFSHPIFSEYRPTVQRAPKDEDLFPHVDVMSVHMSLTRDNQHFLNRRRLMMCRRGVYIVNVSRGALVDQRAMADLVRSGHVAGYGADVLDPEPVQPDNPLVGLANVHLTPHVGSRTFESVIRQGSAAVDNLIAALKEREALKASA
ncbi:MAG: phosphoglycerate dehydrogenase [Pseudomonadota bacterium]|jgi:D-3-phosphoglycerate dehydrogenase